jgi:hypothetical protein
MIAFTVSPAICLAQGHYEKQVYAFPTIGKIRLWCNCTAITALFGMVQQWHGIKKSCGH